MSWFLVLLFWNPAIQDYQVADGWAALSMPSFERCENRMDYVKKYLPSFAPDNEHLVGCVFAENVEAATAIMKEQ